jgi:hypothetical protein
MRTAVVASLCRLRLIDMPKSAGKVVNVWFRRVLAHRGPTKMPTPMTLPKYSGLSDPETNRPPGESPQAFGGCHDRTGKCDSDQHQYDWKYVITCELRHCCLQPCERLANGFMHCSSATSCVSHDVYFHDWNSGYGAAAHRVRAQLPSIRSMLMSSRQPSAFSRTTNLPATSSECCCV